jgi:hypothetical protein
VPKVVIPEQQNNEGQSTSHNAEPQRKKRKEAQHQPMDANDVNRPGHIRLIDPRPGFDVREYVCDEPMDKMCSEEPECALLYDICNLL